MKKNILIGHLREYMQRVPRSTAYSFQMRAYGVVIKKIQALDVDQVNSMIIDEMDLTPYMKKKLKGMLKLKKTPEKGLQYQLQEVAGIGVKLAQTLIKKGVSSVSDLKKKQYLSMLPLASQVDIKYRPIKPIPRYMIEYLETQMKQIHPRIPMVFVGSYRRHKTSSSDVDVLIQKEYLQRVGTTEFIKMVNSHLSNIQVYTPYAIGPSKISTIVRLKKYKINLKMDLFVTPRIEYPFALLYSTGSKEFNINMRRIAKTKGYLLNQRGIYLKGKRVDPKKFKSEKDIFQFLNMRYVLPKRR